MSDLPAKWLNEDAPESFIKRLLKYAYDEAWRELELRPSGAGDETYYDHVGRMENVYVPWLVRCMRDAGLSYNKKYEQDENQSSVTYFSASDDMENTEKLEINVVYAHSRVIDILLGYKDNPDKHSWEQISDEEYDEASQFIPRLEDFMRYRPRIHVL